MSASADWHKRTPKRKAFIALLWCLNIAAILYAVVLAGVAVYICEWRGNKLEPRLAVAWGLPAFALQLVLVFPLTIRSCSKSRAADRVLLAISFSAIAFWLLAWAVLLSD